MKRGRDRDAHISETVRAWVLTRYVEKGPGQESIPIASPAPPLSPPPRPSLSQSRGDGFGFVLFRRLSFAVRCNASSVMYTGWFQKSWVRVLPLFLLGPQGSRPVPLRLFSPFMCFLYFLNTFHSKVPDYILGA